MVNALENQSMENWEADINESLKEIRKTRMSVLRNKADALNWCKDLKAWFCESIGPLATVKKQRKEKKGVIECGVFVIEKWLYEVFDGVMASANFYIPKKMNKEGLSILAPLGHWKEGKLCNDYQNMASFMALHGVPVLVYDHCGLGERREFFDPIRNVQMKGTSPVNEHIRFGDLAITTGYQSANYFLSEVQQSLQFMRSFPFIKKDKIGISGASGGGSISREAACYFDDLAFSIPVCIIREENTLTDSCHEQVVWGEGLQGVSHIDYLTSICPKPAMLVTERKKDFSEQSFASMEKIFTLAGAKKTACGYYSIDDVHGYTHPMIEAVYKFLCTNFNLPKMQSEKWEKVINRKEELQISKGGFLNREFKQTPMSQVVLSRVSAKKNKLNKSILSELLGVQRFDDVPSLDFTGDQKTKEITLSDNLHQNGNLLFYRKKEQPLGWYEGYGNIYYGNEASYGRLFLSYGATLIGFRVAQLLKFAQKNPEVKLWKSDKEFSIELLCAAALGGKKLFASVQIDQLLVSYQSLIDAEINLFGTGQYIPGILNFGDIDSILKLVDSSIKIEHRIDSFWRIV